MVYKFRLLFILSFSFCQEKLLPQNSDLGIDIQIKKILIFNANTSVYTPHTVMYIFMGVFVFLIKWFCQRDYLGRFNCTVLICILALGSQRDVFFLNLFYATPLCK